MPSKNIDTLLEIRSFAIAGRQRKHAETYDAIIREQFPDHVLDPLPWAEPVKPKSRISLPTRAQEPSPSTPATAPHRCRHRGSETILHHEDAKPRRCTKVRQVWRRRSEAGRWGWVERTKSKTQRHKDTKAQRKKVLSRVHRSGPDKNIFFSFFVSLCLRVLIATGRSPNVDVRAPTSWPLRNSTASP